MCRRGPIQGIIGGGVALWAAGCSAPLEGDFEGPDPGSRLRAVVSGASDPSQEDLQGMVEALGSDDPALRLMAIAALERTVGERFGYDAWAPEGERQEAIGRWRQWLGSPDARQTELSAETSADR